MSFPELTAIQWYILLGVLALFILLSFLAIRDALRRKFPKEFEHLIWIQTVCLLPFVGPLIYFVFARRRGEKIR